LEFAFIKTHPATTNLSEVLQTNWSIHSTN
jgi:hypothetical protein